MQKKPIIIISVLCVISLVLGYLSGLKDEESLSNRDAGTDSKKEPEFLKEGLVAYYPFNGNAEDESGNGHDGEVVGATLTYDRNGEEGSAYHLDGEDDRISLDPNLFRKDSFTISIWLQADTISYNDRLINGGLGLSIALHSDQSMRSWWPTSVIHSHPVSQKLTLGEWHHFVISVEKQEIKFFSNSESIISAIYPRSSISLFEFGTPFRDQSGIHGGYFDGKLDDIRIYNRALSAEEVEVLYEFEKPQIKPETLEEGLVAYYPFNGNAKDESGKNHHATVNGGATLTADRFGDASKAYSLDGIDDSIDSNDTINIPLDLFTYSIWVQPDNSQEGETWETFVSRAVVPVDNKNLNWFGMPHHENPRSLRLHASETGWLDSAQGVVAFNQWSHFIGTYDGTTAKIYLNGQLVAEGTTSPEPPSTSYKFSIGRDYSINPEFLSGLVDDVRIYNRALSAEEVKALYEFEKAN